MPQTLPNVAAVFLDDAETCAIVKHGHQQPAQHVQKSEQPVKTTTRQATLSPTRARKEWVRPTRARRRTVAAARRPLSRPAAGG